MKLKLTVAALLLCITAVSCSNKNDSSYTSPESSGASIKGI